MILFPNAKINLGLNILRKRPDGFHDLETVFYPLQLSDILEINYSEEFSFSQTGIIINGDPEANLIVQAYRLMEKEFQLKPVSIHLHKIVPFGAGLGGGSSDAAFTLIALNKLFDLNLSNEELQCFAARLGSDCPFFILNKPVFAEGRGEVFSDISVALKGYYLVLVKPNVHVPTALAYSNITPVVPVNGLRNLLLENSATWRNKVMNDFEPSVFRLFPEVEMIKKKLYEIGAQYASMSGSGSSVFGIFKEAPKNLSTDFNSCLVWQEELK